MGDRTYKNKEEKDAKAPSDSALTDDGNGETNNDNGCCYKRAALAFHQADYLLILAGAGMSADSGLKTYETMPDRYRQLCDPARMATMDDNNYNYCHEFQQFWYDFAVRYADTQPHRGYDILDQWCHGGKLKRLSKQDHTCSGSETETPKGTNDKQESNAVAGRSSLEGHKWWVYTSNVDGHFRRYPSWGPWNNEEDKSSNNSNSNVSSNVCEIHGYAGVFRCSCGIGYAGGIGPERFPRMGPPWNQWNQRVDECPTVTQKCHFETESLQELLQRTAISSSSSNNNNNNINPQEQPQPRQRLLLCKNCGTLPLRPNVLLFNDTDENVLVPIQRQRDLYQDWEAMVEDRVCHEKKRLVLVELGCGKTVPAVRQESEDVLRDATDLLRCGGSGTQDGGRGDDDEAAAPVTLVRINPRDAEPDGRHNASSVVSIFDTSLRALERIDRELDALL